MNELLAKLLEQITRVADSLEIMAMMQIPPEQDEELPSQSLTEKRGRVVAHLKK